MASVARSRVVLASPSDVWSVLSAFGEISRWAPNVDHSCMMSDVASGVGAVRRIQAGSTVVLETVLTWEPDVGLSYRLDGLPPVLRSVVNSWSLTPNGAGSTLVVLTSTIDAGSKPPQRAIAAAVGQKLASASDDMLDGIMADLRSRPKVGGVA
jgi:hypothetical protein